MVSLMLRWCIQSTVMVSRSETRCNETRCSRSETRFNETGCSRSETRFNETCCSHSETLSMKHVAVAVEHAAIYWIKPFLRLRKIIRAEFMKVAANSSDNSLTEKMSF